MRMDQTTLFEVIGYIGSAFVLSSFLMTSVVKLRIINSVGSIVTVFYGLLIHAYPTVVMNLCLLVINIVYLTKVLRTEIEYALVESSIDDPHLRYFLKRNAGDILAYYPNFSPDDPRINFIRTIYCDDKPVAAAAGALNNGCLQVFLDYATPEFRDASPGKFLYNCIAKQGIQKVVFPGKSEKQAAYLLKLGFVPTKTGYEKLISK